MHNNFSHQVKEVLSFSREEALRLGSDCIGTEHLLLGMIKEDHNAAVTILKSLHVELVELKKEVEKSIEAEKEEPDNNPRKAGLFKFFSKPRRGLPLNKQAEKAIRESVLQAKDTKSPTVETEHLMLSILKNPEDIGTKILSRYDVDYNKAAFRLRQGHL